MDAPEDRPPADGFATWWAAARECLPDPPQESAARTTWDAAVRQAVEALDREVNRLVTSAAYHEAAAVRDCRCVLERLFAVPGQWNHLQASRARDTDCWLKLLRSLSTERVSALGAQTPPGNVLALAAKLVLIERR